MSNSEFDLDMDELSSAEDFFDYFGIDYEPSVVHVNRLHILQRFHDYMDQVETIPESDEGRTVCGYAAWCLRRLRQVGCYHREGVQGLQDARATGSVRSSYESEALGDL